MRELIGGGLVDWGDARIDGRKPGGLGRGLVDWGDARIDGERPGGLGRCEN